MSDEHKAALAQGRSEGRAVREYLEALRANKPKRGRKRTPDSIKKRLAVIDDQLESADPLGTLGAAVGGAIEFTDDGSEPPLGWLDPPEIALGLE